MAQESFTKLVASLLSSTVWNEDNETRIVWITMLALADRRGYVGASLPGLAHQARVPIEAVEKALSRLSSPDPHSRSKELDGRRIIDAERGWLIVNYGKHRGFRDFDERREYDRDRKRRERSADVPSVHTCPPMSAAVRRGPLESAESAHAEAEADTEADRDLGSYQIEDQHNTEVRTGADRARAEKSPPTDLAVWNPNGRAVHSQNSLAANRHLRCHPAAMAACQRGICIPAFLVQQWHSQLDPDQASPANSEQAVRTFIAAVLSGLPKGPIGDDPLKFWRAQWEHAHGAQAPAAKSGKLSAVKETQANAKIALEALRNRRDANGQRRTGSETHPLAHAPANRHAIAKT
jgi:hypothetical protein